MSHTKDDNANRTNGPARPAKTLALRRQTLRKLTAEQLRNVVAGVQIIHVRPTY
jgi:hypothetical protein